MKEVFPTTPLIGYFEFFYRHHGADVGFEPGPSLIFDVGPRIRTKNLGNLLALNAVDHGQCPTKWQKSLYPKEYQSKLHILHEGIDTQIVAPDLAVRFTVPNTDIELTATDEVVTNCSRRLKIDPVGQFSAGSNNLRFPQPGTVYLGKNRGQCRKNSRQNCPIEPAG